MAQELIAAEKRLLAVLTGDHSPAETAVACGKIHDIAGDHQVAEGFYREALRHSPESLEALARLVIVTLTRGDLAEGLALARQLEEANADFVFETITGKPVTTMTVLGDALRLNGELSRAKSAYETSVRLTQGKDRHSLAHLADALLQRGPGSCAEVRHRPSFCRVDRRDAPLARTPDSPVWREAAGEMVRER
ncbi:hypothetical protein K1Y78_42335 [Streptomyces sp. tea 10]|nr:hypothetical protein [Streptomyces sp. tea 10]